MWDTGVKCEDLQAHRKRRGATCTGGGRGRQGCAASTTVLPTASGGLMRLPYVPTYMYPLRDDATLYIGACRH